LKQDTPTIRINDTCSSSGFIYGRNAARSGTRYDAESINQNDHGYDGTLTVSNGVAQFGDDIRRVHFELTFEKADRLRFSFRDAGKSRWEPPSFLLTDKSPFTSENDSKFSVKFNKSPFSLKITRKSDNQVLFDTNVSPLGLSNLVFKDQYLQLATRLPKNSALFGLGESIRDIKLGYTTYTMWNNDNADPENQNL